MHTPIVTMAASGILGLILVALSARVVIARTTSNTLLGSGGSDTTPLFIASRSHANFAEYVPLCLLLIGGLELRYGPSTLVKVLAAVLVLARIAHPIGMEIKGANPLRAGGFVGTILVLTAASISALAALLM